MDEFENQINEIDTCIKILFYEKNNKADKPRINFIKKRGANQIKWWEK